MRDTGDAWSTFVELVARWYASPVEPDHGCTDEEIRRAEGRLGVTLPAALRQFHALVGRRLARFAQEPIFTLSQLRNDDGYLRIAGEAQGCFVFGIKAEETGERDPRVWRVTDGGEDLASDTLSSFLQVLTLRDAALRAGLLSGEQEVGALGKLRPIWGGHLEGVQGPDLEDVLGSLEPLLSPVRWLDTELFGDEETLVLRQGGDGAWGIALSDEAWEDLLDRLPGEHDDQEASHEHTWLERPSRSRSAGVTFDCSCGGVKSSRVDARGFTVFDVRVP